MRIYKQFLKSIFLTALLFTCFFVAGMAQDSIKIVGNDTKTPLILTTSPTAGEMNVNLASVIEVTFNSDMDEKSINETTLLLHVTYADTMYEEYKEIPQEQITDNLTIEYSDNSWQYITEAVGGTISYSNKVAIFTPDWKLKEGTQYTFTVTSGVKNLENIALENDQTWSFITIGTLDLTSFYKQNSR